MTLVQVRTPGVARRVSGYPPHSPEFRLRHHRLQGNELIVPETHGSMRDNKVVLVSVQLYNAFCCRDVLAFTRVPASFH